MHAFAGVARDAGKSEPDTVSASFVTGLVLAAGGSKRLGQPKQLLPYGSATLLDHVLGTARACEFDQLLCVIGGSSQEIEATVDLDGVQVVENDHFGEGCSSSIAAALTAVDSRCEVLVLMLGDQPGVTAATVASLLAGRGDRPLAACAYHDGRGHPLAFARSTFDQLAVAPRRQGSMEAARPPWRRGDRRARRRSDPSRRRHLGGLRGCGRRGGERGEADQRVEAASISAATDRQSVT